MVVGRINRSHNRIKTPIETSSTEPIFLFTFRFKDTIQASAITVAREILSFWEKARIPTRQECHIVSQIKKMHNTWQCLKKNSSRTTETQKSKEASFVATLDNLFDVAHHDALNITKMQEDIEFLLAQRQKGRRGSMGPVDMKLTKKEARSQQRENEIESRKKKETDRLIQNEFVTVTQMVTNSSDNEASDTRFDYEDTPFSPIGIARYKRGRSNIINLDVAAALDRSKISDRKATYVLAAAAQSFGYNPQEIAVNKESIRRARHKHRELVANEIKSSFNPNIPLTVHWDGKLLPALTGSEKVERLAVIVSGDGLMKLLGVPKIINSTGETQATAVFNLITEWNLQERIQFMCFDTTAINTGIKIGASVLLQQKFKREIINLACRHHILELIVQSVFDKLMGSSSGPNIKLFQRFANFWSSIDKTKYESGIKDNLIAAQLMPMKENLLRFFRTQLLEYQPRDDYKELLQLALLFLGNESTSEIHIHKPGAFHRARWMGKLIYCIKIFLFRSTFLLTAHELSGLREFNVFVVQLYLKAWFTAQNATLAPHNDLQFLKELVAYKNSNEIVCKAAVKSFSRHLWYLSETLVGLALFDSRVNVDIKRKMVLALNKEGQKSPPCRIKLDEITLQEKDLSNFVTNNTKKLFVAFGIPQCFLNEDPMTWQTNESFIEGYRRIRNLKVVNDAAERGISMVQSFNTVLTNQEEQKQYLLQLVEKHRQEMPNANKSTILEGLHKQLV